MTQLSTQYSVVALRHEEDHLAVLLGERDDRAPDVAVPAHAEVDLAALGALDERRVDRVHVRLDVDQQLLGRVDLGLVLGVDRVAERGERERADLGAALEEVHAQVGELRRLEQVEAVLDAGGGLGDLVGQPVEARDAVVLRHRVDVARVVVGLGERGRDVLHVRDQLVRERDDQPEVGHRLDRVAGGGDDVEVRAPRAQLGEQLVVGAEAGDRHLRPVLLLVGLVVRRVGVVDPVGQQQVALLDLAVGGRRRLVRGLLLGVASAASAAAAAPVEPPQLAR